MSSRLCDGPRGRRVVIELVRDLLPEEMGRGLFELAYRADVAAGAAVTRLTFRRVGDDGGQTPSVPSPEQLADAIRALGPLRPDGEELVESVRRSVDTARYWQAADGDDLVAADPVVTSALADVGAGLARRPDAAWWQRDRSIEQWAVEFDPDGDGAPFDPAPGGVQRWRERTEAGESRARIDRPADPTAGWSGDWWSHPWGAPHTTGVLSSGLPAGIPYVEDGFGWTRAVAIPVRGAGRTYEIHGAADWAHLCRTYPLDVTNSRRHDWYRITGRGGRWLLPDWSRVADDWDAVHLSGWGYLTAATREIVVDAEYSSVIGGWGPDETYWLTGKVREIDEPRVHWDAEERGDPWRRVDGDGLSRRPAR